MAAVSSQSLQQTLVNILESIRARPFSTVAVGSFAIMFLKRVNKDYHDWLDLGPGGVSYNAWGYILSYALGLMGTKDIKSTVCYEPMMSSKGHLEDVPVREGIAPVISKWTFPVRQLSARAGKERIQVAEQMLHELASKHEFIFVAPSILEGGFSSAIFVEGNSDDTAANKKPAKARELFHLHDSEGSAHVNISPADAKALLDKGWGQRHPFSGRMLNLALTYIMIYAPRNDTEMEFIRKIAEAAINNALERRKNGSL